MAQCSHRISIQIGWCSSTRFLAGQGTVGVLFIGRSVLDALCLLDSDSMEVYRHNHIFVSVQRPQPWLCSEKTNRNGMPRSIRHSAINRKSMSPFHSVHNRII